MNTDELQGWLIERLAQLRGMDRGAIDVRERFSRYGLDSMATTRLVTELSTKLGHPLSPTLAWEYPTIEAVVRHLTGGGAGESPEPLAPDRSLGLNDEPVAVVGMACRFPKAPDLATFWRLLCEGVDAITQVPEGRWDVDSLFDEDPSAPGKLSTRWGGFLDRVDHFDPQFFGISPREAVQMDPQQRLVLELAWEALEDAGIPPRSLQDSRTGVFVGAMWHDYAAVPADPLGAITQHTATGQDLSIIPARVSYTLGLRGPSVALNTASSSSLVAIHYARRSLQLGECGLALAGGVNLLLSPESMVAISKFGAMAPDGRSKAFDSRANGYVRGEGGGVVVLKPRSRALADGDRIYCLLLGSAVNNDGFSNGLTAPSPKAQELMLQDAYADAGIDVRDVHYIETHGTGTMLGDPIEAAAIGAVLGAGRPADRPLLLGAVKTNIGHLEAAAGVAGLIKTALALKHRVVPANLHFREPNPHIPFDALRLKVPTSVEPWPEHTGRVLAGVSAFGFGGTNCHVVLEGAAREHVALLPLAERDPEGLRRIAERAGRPLPVFVFAGQGSQWLRMGVDLLREPAFQAAIERCDRAMMPYLQSSIVDVLLSDHAAWLEDTARVQPAIFAVQVALAALVRSFGVEPSAVVGQSMGEVAAAYVAGCLSLDDAAHVICLRSRLVGRASGRGAMAIVDLPIEAAKRALEGRGDRIAIAVNSSPSSTVLSGDGAALEALIGELERAGVSCQRIKVNYASHSPEMDPILPAFEEALESIRPQRGSVPFYSTVAGDRLDGSALDAAYWCRNLRDPALFAETVARLIGEGHDFFLEIDPHGLLVRSIEQCLVAASYDGLALPAMRRDKPGRAVLFEALGALYVRGQKLALHCLYPAEARSSEVLSALGLPALSEQWPADEAMTAALLPLSAHVPEALRDLAHGMADFLRQRPGVPLSDIYYTASVRRSHHAHRLAVVGRSREELAAALEAHVRGEEPSGLTQGKASSEVPKVVFVFSGQGSQWAGMGRRLLEEEPVFGQALRACDAALWPQTGFSVIDELLRPEPSSRLAETQVAQPALFAMEVALAALLRSWGVEPGEVMGHSVGEIAAAHVAGILDLEQAARVVAVRGQLMQKATGQGKMVSVALGEDEAQKLLEGVADRAAIAAINEPGQVVLSGETEVIDGLLERLSGQGVESRPVRVNYAFHSPQMEPLRAELVEALGALVAKGGTIPLISTVRGEQVRGEELDGAYWGDNVRQPVRLAQAIHWAARRGPRLFVEVGPHPVLSVHIEQTLSVQGDEGRAVPTLRRHKDEQEQLRWTVGKLYVQGHPVDWQRLYPEGGRVVDLPTYPWQRKRFWIESGAQVPGASRGARRTGPDGSEHPLLGASLSSSTHPEERMWEQGLSVEVITYLADHRVQGEVVFPEAGYVEMALAAGAATLGAAELVLEEVAFEQTLELPDDGERIVQLVLTEQGAGRCTFQIASRDKDATAWTKHASGTVGLRGGEAGPERTAERPEALKQRLVMGLGAAEHYRRLRARQMDYGPAFQGLLELWIGEGEVLGRVGLPEDVNASGYTLHPALLDACLQVATALFLDVKETYVLGGIRRLHLRARPSRQAWVVARSRAGEEADGEDVLCDLRIVDDEERLLVEIEALRARRLEAMVRGPRASDLRVALARVSREEGLALLERFLSREAGHVLRLEPSRIERSAPFGRLGMDSLMMLELRNRIRLGISVDLSNVILMRYDHVGALASYLLERLSLEHLVEEVRASTDEITTGEDMESVTI